MATQKTSRRSRKSSPDSTELLVMELQQIHSAETQLSRVLPRLSKAAESEPLRKLIEQRQEQGERLIEQLEAAFDELEESPGRKRNVAAEGLINDAREHAQEIESGPALDAVLIASLQKTEHYCIAAWGTARSLAQAGDAKTAARAMENALKEGKSLDERLTQLAEKEITPALLAGESEDAAAEGRQGETRSRRDGGSERHAPTHS